MGLCRMGPPEELVLRLARELRIPYFVETGTLRGHTAAWASGHFRQVWTIEFAKKFHDRARERHRTHENVRFVFGDSRLELLRVVSELDAAAIFWLDAHWSGGATYGAKDQCPILQELAAIDQCRHPAYLLIDDARLFLSPPPPPYDLQEWPDMTRVLGALGSSRYVVVIEDVIVAVPAGARPVVAGYCREVNARAWEAFRRDERMSGVRKGVRLIRQDVGGRLRRWAGAAVRWPASTRGGAGGALGGDRRPSR